MIALGDRRRRQPGLDDDPAASDANTIARQNPTHDLDGAAVKNSTLHPLHPGDASIPILRSRDPAETHSGVRGMAPMRQ